MDPATVRPTIDPRTGEPLKVAYAIRSRMAALVIGQISAR